jgi:5'-3' exonuclease
MRVFAKVDWLPATANSYKMKRERLLRASITSERSSLTLERSHLVGLFSRTIRMIDSGIKPVYVFDGKPPQLKQVVVRRFFH